MRVDRQTIGKHHAAILEAAGRLFRRHGVAAVPVAEVTREAGLTHGAFYGHFPSKDALAAEACRASLEDSARRWTRRADRARSEDRDPIAALIDAYLTEAHRDAPEDGCVLPALGAEIARAEPPLSDALSGGVAALAAVLERELARRDPAMAEADRTRTALAMLAAMAGGIVLARACRSDPARSRAALEGAATLAREAAGPSRRPA
jgi:TetR/AcrR family transcriptional regulator, transcriptional repressor for nem operon